MDRPFFIDLARGGARLPIATHMVLSEQPDHDAILLDGERLGAVIVQTAQRYRTPLALPLMDLAIEKQDLLTTLGVPAEEVETFHFTGCPDDEAMDRARAIGGAPLTPRMKASLDAIRHVAATPGLVPMGMAIGPFSLMTKLLSDPITPVFMAGAGTTAADDDEVRAVERCLELAMATVERSLRLQAQAGARAVCVCEPAANAVYLSPKQLAADGDVFERYVMTYNRRVKAVLDEIGAGLIFHDCGELTDEMVRRLASLKPVVMSLGSSRRLWEDARLVPEDVVLYGNLPSKKFYSDAEVPVDAVETLTRELATRMRDTGHPFILGTECDVLSVPGAEATIGAKLERMMRCAC